MISIFEKLGGIDATLEVLQRRRGKALGIHSVRSWKHIGYIPGINAAHLLAECMERGIPVSMDDLQDPQKPKSFPRTPPRGQSPAGR